jgi:uncharacterized membrane protein
MKLTKEQIQNLYKFTRQHYVEHFDVQTELVDHLANDIEQILEKQPNLSFEQAKTIAFKKFGVFGFMNVVESRTKALDKKYWKIIFRFVKDWFQLPKIILTSLLFVIFYSICKLEMANYILLAFLTFLCLYTFYKGFILKRTLKRNFQKNGKKWMLEDMIFRTGKGTLLFLPINFYNFFNLFYKGNPIHNNTEAILYATMFTFFIILFYIVLEVLPKKAEELLAETYSEYHFV